MNETAKPTAAMKLMSNLNQASYPSTAKSNWFQKKPISQRELVEITSQLAIMTRTGIDLVTAMESLAKQARRPGPRKVLRSIHRDLVAGKTFSETLAKFDNIFSSTYRASVTAGEASGKMWQVLAQLSTFLRGELKLRNTLKSVASYPLILATISILVVAALVFFVLPQFATIFEQFETPLPWITQALLAVSAELKGRWWLWVPSGSLTVGALFAYFCTSNGKRQFHGFLLKAPLLKSITQPILIGRTCRLLGLMLESGVSLLESLELARNSVSNVLYQNMFSELSESVSNGHGMGTVLRDSGIVPDSAAEMLTTGEKSGELATVASLIGEYFEEDGEERLRGSVAILEPAIAVVMGLIVATVVMSVALPMFDLASFAKG